MGFSATFWGTRGSIPTPGPATQRYGGNTPCVALQAGDDAQRILVLDAGTGIRPLGRELSRRSNGKMAIDLLVSHTHWDHIQGLPFFAPAFAKRNQVAIWGPRQGEVNLEVILRQMMNPVVFPVPLDDLDADLSVAHVEQECMGIGGFEVLSMRVRHPGNTLGYRIRSRGDGAGIAYVTDNELGTGGDYGVSDGWRAEFVDFLAGAELLVHDAMYTAEEVERHRGWGHSSSTEAVEVAAEAGVRKLVLFHHRPEHGDDEIDRMLDQAREQAAGLDSKIEVVAAVEGMTLTVDGG